MTRNSQNKAKAENVWDYANLKKIIILALAESDFLKSIDVNLTKITITGLTADEKEELQTLCQQYKKKFKQYEQHKTVLEIL